MTTWSGTATNSTTGNWAGTGYAWRIHVRPILPKPVGPCPHRLLGVACSAMPGDIRRAYRRLAKIAHPDIGGQGRWMMALNRIYEMASQGGHHGRSSRSS